MKRFILFAALLVVAVAAYQATATEPVNIEGQASRTNTTAYMYKPLVTSGAAASASTWSLDSGIVDTSESYKIIPGSYVTINAKTGAAADSATLIIYGSVDQSTTNWRALDTLANVTAASNNWLDIHQGATNGLKYPVMARYIWITADNSVGATPSAAVITGRIITSADPQ